MKAKKFLLFCGAGILIPAFFVGCRKQKTVTSVSMSQLEAQLYDVALPLGASTIVQTSSGGLVCRTKQSSNSLVAFYQATMEQYGWLQKMVVIDKPITMIFEKPLQLCIILIEQLSKDTKLTIFIQKKEENEDHSPL